MQPKLEEAEKKVKLVDSIKSEIKKFNLKFNEKKDKLVTAAFEPMKNLIEDVLNEFISSDEKIKLEIILKDQTAELEGIKYVNSVIVAQIRDLTTDKITSPDIYFNTFRYKLFTLMVSLSFALANRIKYKINLPLVMDDLFYAGDFVSKHLFTKFLSKVIELFDQKVLGLPLQLIIFTHDDVVFKMAIESTNKQKLSQNTKAYRFFSPLDRAESTEKLSNGDEFWNLLYELPPILTN